jgi:hypothetical protein
MWHVTGEGVIACHRRVGRKRRLLGEDIKDGYVWQPLRFATNGDMAGVIVRYSDKYGSDNLELRVMDARRGKSYRTTISEPNARVSGFVLSSFGSGALAHAQPHEPTRVDVFWRAPPTILQVATLDSAADAFGLRLVTRAQIEWKSDGTSLRAYLPR